MNDNVYKANRVVLLWVALAPAILAGQSLQAQQAIGSAGDSDAAISAVAPAINQSAAKTAGCRTQPYVKNAMPPRTPPCVFEATGPRELTKKEARKLASTAKSREDHLRLATCYKTQADKLDAEGAGYEGAAAAYRQAPEPKNLASPTTAGRYEYYAKTFREDARSYRTLAVAQEQTAYNIVTVASK